MLQSLHFRPALPPVSYTHLSKYALLAIPVLDDDERMVGIVTVDDAMDVMVDEATEDITKMAAMNPSEKPYFETSVWAHAKNRIPWLLVLMLSATVTGTIITRYENAFSALPLLVSFIPVSYTHLISKSGQVLSHFPITIFC